MVLRKGIDIATALRICSFQTLYILGITLPFAFLMGLLLALGRLVADNELVAINAAGTPTHKILRMFILLGLVFSLLLFILNDKVIPALHYNYRNQSKTILYKNINNLIEPGVFLQNFPNYILYVSDKTGNKLKNVYIYEIGGEEKVSRVTFAKRGEFITENDTLRLKLEEGFRDETASKGQNEIYRLNFEVFFMDIPIGGKSANIAKKTKDMDLKELGKEINRLGGIGVATSELEAEYHKRVSFPFSIIAFVILGFGISLRVKHREKSINFGIAIMAGLTGYALFLLAQMAVENRIILPAVGMWLPNGIMLLAGIILFSRYAHHR